MILLYSRHQIPSPILSGSEFSVKELTAPPLQLLLVEPQRWRLDSGCFEASEERGEKSCNVFQQFSRAAISSRLKESN